MFALLAFECNRQGFLDGVHSGEPFRTFFEELWRRHEMYLKNEYAITNKPALEATLTILARLNAAIDYAALDHAGIAQVIFHNRTVQDFFAAIWMCTHASDADVEWFSENRFVRWNKTTHTFYQMWKLATEMPVESEGQMIARKDTAYVKAVGVLYEPSTVDKPAVRSTEMIYRSWPTLEEIGKQEGIVGSASQKVLDDFSGEYQQILAGSRGTESQRICEDFESWFVAIEPHEAGWKGGETDDAGGPLAVVRHRYSIAKYALTNAVFRLFDEEVVLRLFGTPAFFLWDYCPEIRPQRSPVIAVDWYDAWSVAKWLGGEIPTEQQWEYACRAGQQTPYSVGSGHTLTPVEARFGQSSFYDVFPGQNCFAPTEPTDVDAYLTSNPWGIYQMHGNVWEWCSNWHDGSETHRSVRGGSVYEPQEHCQLSFRGREWPGSCRWDLGVRVSRVAAD